MLEQTPGAAAIQAAVIEAQRQLRCRHWNEFFLRFIPARNFLADTEPEQHGLIGQWNRRPPFNSERSEIRDCRDAAGLHVRRNTAFARKIDKFLDRKSTRLNSS